MSHIFIAYSRTNRDVAIKLKQTLEGLGRSVWIDLEDLPPSSIWRMEIKEAIEGCVAFIYLLSRDSIASKYCREEFNYAQELNKRIIPVLLAGMSDHDIPDHISDIQWLRWEDFGENLSQIGDLLKGIDRDYEWAKFHTELTSKAKKWERSKDTSRLLRGAELREAEELLIGIGSQKNPQPTELQGEYVLVSQKNELRQRRQNTISLVFVITFVAILAVFAWIQRNSALASEQNAIAEANARFTALANEAYALSTAQAESNARATAQAVADEQQQVAIAEQLNVQSLTKQESNFSTSLLLGIEAYRKNESPQTKGLLLRNFFAASRLQAYLNGHTERVNDVVYSPDGNMIASASDDNLIILWDANTFLPIGKPLSGHTKWVTTLAFSPDGKFLVSASLDNNIIFWNLETMQPDGEPLRGHIYRTDHVLFTPDGKYLLSIGCSELDGYCQKNQITLWDVESREPIRQSLQLTSGIVNCADFNSDGTLLALCDDNSDVLLIDMHNFKIVSKFSDTYSADLFFAIGSIDFSPDDTMVAVGYHNSIILLSVSDLQPIDFFLNGHTNRVTSIAFSPDGKTLVSGSYDHQVIIWDLSEQEPVEKMPGHTREVTKISYNPTGSSFASSGGDGKIIVWSSQTIETFEKIKVAYPIYDVSINPHSNLLAFAGDSNVIGFLNIKEMAMIGKVQIPGAVTINSLEFSHTGDILAVGFCAKEQVEAYCVQGDIILIDAINQAIMGEPLSKHTREIISLSFSPEDNWLASGSSDDKLIIWNVHTSNFERVLSEHSNWVSSLDFSPNGKLIVSGSYDNTILFWETDGFSLANQYAIGHSAWVTSLQFSPDGKKLASGGWDGVINLWDTATQKLIGNPMKEFEWTEILSIAFSPDGQILASGKTDKSVTLWDVEVQQMIGEPLKAHTHFVNSVVFSPDGNYLVSAGEDGRIVVWNIGTESIIDKTCLRVGRNFTQAEWQQYFPNEPYRFTCPQFPAGE